MHQTNQLTTTQDCPAAEPSPNEEGLSDDALSAAGLKRVSAYVRQEESGNAARVRKAREKAATTGVQQLNVVAPAAARDAIKKMAADLRDGCDLRLALEQALSVEAQKTDPLAVVRVAPAYVLRNEERMVQRLRSLRGWQKFLAKLLRLI
jgi:Na+-translocating ferredoxin:NAD+ oxidoreductase RNF subunit RnfB